MASARRSLIRPHGRLVVYGVFDDGGASRARAFRDARALEDVAATRLDVRASSFPATSNTFEPKKEIRSARPDGDAFAQLQRLARDCPLTAADLTAPERAEARRLAADPDYPASALAADLVRQWDALDVRERTAALYALALATTPGRSFAA